MRHRRLGTTGLRVSTLSLGTMTWGQVVDHEGARDLLRTFVEAGGSLVDTAFGYGGGDAEAMLGSLLGELVPRDELVLATKAGISRRDGRRVVDCSRGTLMDQLDASLARLGTDHVDLWLVHTWDDEVPLTETLSALEWAVGTGRARYVGVSNYAAWQSARAATMLAQARVPLTANEVEFSLLHREPEVEQLAAAQALGYGILAWSPLGRGVLTGKYRSGIPSDSRATSGMFPGFTERFLDDRASRVVEAVTTAARGTDTTPTQVSLAWLLAQPSVSSAVLGARTVPQLAACLAADDLDLPGPLLEALSDASA